MPFYFTTFSRKKKGVICIFQKASKKKRSALRSRLCLLAVLPLCLTACKQAETAKTEQFFAMDTAVTLTLPKADNGASRKTLERLSGTLDCYAPDSETARLNAAGTLTCREDLTGLIRNTLALEQRFGSNVQLTGGAVTTLWGVTTDHPQVPDAKALAAACKTVNDGGIRMENADVTLPTGAKLDFGAVAKGYALDVLRAQWDATGYAYGIASMHSSILLYGSKPDGKPFSVQIQKPDGTGMLGTVSTESCFVATSGGYERYFEADGVRYCHIFDLQTGQPVASDLTTVTVFAESGLMADYLSTLIYLEGRDSLPTHLAAKDYKLVAADADGTLYRSDGLAFTEASS